MGGGGSEQRTIELGRTVRKSVRSGDRMERKEVNKCEQARGRANKRGVGQRSYWVLLAANTLPAGGRFRSAVPTLPSGGFHLLCVRVCVCACMRLSV